MNRRSLMLSANEELALQETLARLNRKLSALNVPLLSAPDLLHIIIEQGLRDVYVTRHGDIQINSDSD